MFPFFYVKEPGINDQKKRQRQLVRENTNQYIFKCEAIEKETRSVMICFMKPDTYIYLGRYRPVS